jgi:cytochrome c biogenesis protein CcdA
VAAGIGFHQAATCLAIIGRIRQRLLESETGLMAGSRDVEQRERGYGELSTRFHQLFRLSVRAQHIALSLARLRERFDDDEDRRAMPIARRFAEAQLAAETLQVDVRRTSDGIASMLSVQQLVANRAQAAAAEAQEATVRDAQTASDRFQRRLTIVGAAVLIPALVAAVYGANVKLPGKNQPRGLAAMLFFMLGFGLVTWWAIEAQNRDAWPRFGKLRAADGYVHASLIAGATAVILGVLTLAITDPKLGGGTVAAGLAGGFVTSLALGALSWLAFYIGRSANSPAELRQRRACRGAAVAAAVAAAGGLVLTFGLF